MTPLSSQHANAGIAGHQAECARLDPLLADARAGQSAVLVLCGEPGIGKTALLGYAAGRAAGFQVVRAVGVESEMELPFAGLHQLCGTMLDGLGRLPPPQRDALGTAFGLSSGAQPDRFLVGLAVLSLLSEAAEQRPPAVFPGCFANGLPASAGAVLAATQRPLATSTFTDQSGVPAWQTIPSWDIVGTADHIITPAEQLFMANRAHAHITEINAPHLSMITDPGVVASVIIQAAQATS
jgi:hypothetical protein